MKKVDDALAYFNQGNGFNCAQSVLTVFGPDLGLSREMSLKVSSLFGGGIGRSGETCGAVTGALMALGLKYGVTEMEEREAIKNATGVARDFLQRFSEVNGSVKCKELLGFDINSEEGLAQIKDQQLAKTACSGFIKDAVEILDEFL